MSKKWQIIILILLGVLGYWSIMNSWVFEGEIHEDKYGNEVLGRWTLQSSSVVETFLPHFLKKGMSEVYFEFSKDNTFRRYCSAPCGNFLYEYESWKILGKDIEIEFWYNREKLISFSGEEYEREQKKIKYKIMHLSNHYLILRSNNDINEKGILIFKR